jgi:hypothetical protein
LLPAVLRSPVLCLLSPANALAVAEGASRWGAVVAFVELLKKLLLQSIVVPLDALLLVLPPMIRSILWGLCVQEHRVLLDVCWDRRGYS